jgi:hypothetical protein
MVGLDGVPASARILGAQHKLTSLGNIDRGARQRGTVGVADLTKGKKSNARSSTLSSVWWPPGAKERQDGTRSSGGGVWFCEQVGASKFAEKQVMRLQSFHPEL